MSETGSVRARVQVQTLLELGRYAEAVDAARQALQSEPDAPDLTRLLALALVEIGKGTGDGGAQEAAERAVHLEPNSSASYRVLGFVLLRNGWHAAATERLGQALHLDPLDLGAHSLRAEALLAQAASTTTIGSRGLAVHLARQAHVHAAETVRLNPSGAVGYLLHAKACLLEDDAGSADRWAREGLGLEPTNPHGHEVLGAIAQARGHTRQAADHFLRAGKLEPTSDSPIWHMRRLRTGRVGVLGRPHLRARLGYAGVMVGTFVVVAVLMSAAGAPDGSGGVAVLSAFVAGFLVQAVVPRWKARRSMSPEARLALDRHARLDGGWRRRWLRWRRRGGAGRGWGRWRRRG